MKRILTLTLVILTVLSSLTGCADKNTADTQKRGDSLSKDFVVGNIPINFPLTTTSETLNILSVEFNGNNSEDVFVWQEYEKMTGVKINWNTVERSVRSQEVAAALTNGQKLDLIIRC